VLRSTPCFSGRAGDLECAVLLHELICITLSSRSRLKLAAGLESLVRSDNPAAAYVSWPIA